MKVVLVSKCSLDIEQYVEFKMSVLISSSKSLISLCWVTNDDKVMGGWVGRGSNSSSSLSRPGGCSSDQGFPIKGQRQLKDKWSDGKLKTMAHHWPNKYGLGKIWSTAIWRRPALDTCIECLHTEGRENQ